MKKELLLLVKVYKQYEKAKKQLSVAHKKMNLFWRNQDYRNNEVYKAKIWDLQEMEGNKCRDFCGLLRDFIAQYTEIK